MVHSCNFHAPPHLVVLLLLLCHHSDDPLYVDISLHGTVGPVAVPPPALPPRQVEGGQSLGHELTGLAGRKATGEAVNLGARG